MSLQFEMKSKKVEVINMPGHVAKSVTCLTADMCLTADQDVASMIQACSWSHTFVEIDHEIISAVILLPCAESRKVVYYKGKYVHGVLGNRLVKIAQEKCG